MSEKKKFYPNRLDRSRVKRALAAGGLAAAITAGTGGVHLIEESERQEVREATEQQIFEQNKENIEGTYNTFEVTDIFKTQITEVEVGGLVPSTAGGDAGSSEGVPSVTITLKYEDGDRAQEFMEALPVGENDTSELTWGPHHELRVDNYFLDKNGERMGVVLPSYMLESEGGDDDDGLLWPNSIGMEAGGGVTSMVMPFNSLGEREAYFYETLDISVASTNQEDEKPLKEAERFLGTMTFSVTQDGVEIVEPFEPAEAASE